MMPRFSVCVDTTPWAAMGPNRIGSARAPQYLFPVQHLWLHVAPFAVAGALSACGGSASETPWPLEPDPREPPKPTATATGPVEPAGGAEPSTFLPPESKAPSTWGARPSTVAPSRGPLLPAYGPGDGGAQ